MLSVGDRAPGLRLPSATGSHIDLADYRGRANTIVWFSKGMACPFCRQKLSQLARVANRLHDLGAEVLYVTTTTQDRARLYAQRFQVPFPYLCDPDRAARRAWGIEVRAHSLPWYAAQLVKGLTMPKPESDFGKLSPSPGEIPGLLTDEDMGFFIVDRGGTVRFALAGSYLVDGSTARGIPSNDDIVRELERCTAAG